MIAVCAVMFQIKRHSWEIKNFVPRDEPEVPLLMASVDRQLSSEHVRSSDDDELGQMCNDLLDDDHPHLSPLPVIDKSALADDSSIVGMSHDIDDVVDSVINHDDLPPLADLSELPVLPPPSLPLANVPIKPAVMQPVESTLKPKLECNMPVPSVTYVNNEPAVLVRLRRLNFHRYRSPDSTQHVDVSASLTCVQSVNVTSVPETTCRSTQSMSASDGTTCRSTESMSALDGTGIVKKEPTVSTSKHKQNGAFTSKSHKSLSTKRESSSEKSLKSHTKTSVGSCIDESRQSAVVVLSELPAETLRSGGQVLCSDIVTDRPAVTISRSSKSSSVKRKLDTGAVSETMSDVKKQRTDAVAMPTANVNKLQYVMTIIATYCLLSCHY